MGTIGRLALGVHPENHRESLRLRSKAFAALRQVKVEVEVKAEVKIKIKIKIERSTVSATLW